MFILYRVVKRSVAETVGESASVHTINATFGIISALEQLESETSEVFVVRRAANLLANSIVSSKLVSSKSVSKHLLAVIYL